MTEGFEIIQVSGCFRVGALDVKSVSIFPILAHLPRPCGSLVALTRQHSTNKHPLIIRCALAPYHSGRSVLPCLLIPAMARKS